jgi:hypothetical protein
MASPVISAADLEKRRRCEALRASLQTERSSFDAHWKDLSEFILPRRARFVTSDVNKGDKRHQKIIDSSATKAAGTLRSGMMAGVTSPARPWFRLSVPYPELAELPQVKAYLYETTRRMETVFAVSNVYNKLPTLYGDLGVFGTAAMAVMEDDETVIRCYDFPLGSFFVANDGKLRVRTFVRPFRLTVQQVVERWGHLDASGQPDFKRGEPSVLSVQVQDNWNRGNFVAWVDLVQIIQPNVAYDGAKFESKYKRYVQCYYETGKTEAGFLEETGFDEFPILVARWETSGEDVYGTNCPGMEALGDIRQLQTGEKRAAQAIEKLINPPLTGGRALMNTRVSVLPGDVTYDDPREAGVGIRPTYQIQFRLDQLEAKQQQVRLRVQRSFFEDLFLMLASSDRREITAREVEERHEEKLLAVGPVLEQLNQDVLDPLVERTFNIMNRRGLLPDVPQELDGVPLKIEYISIMATAQKAIALGALERFAGFVSQVATVNPEIMDRVDDDELIEQYADATGIPPKVLRSADAAAEIRQARAKAAQMQQAAANAPAIAGAVKDLSQAPTGGDNALAKLLGSMRAKQAVSATSGPLNVGLN